MGNRSGVVRCVVTGLFMFLALLSVIAFGLHRSAHPGLAAKDDSDGRGLTDFQQPHKAECDRVDGQVAEVRGRVDIKGAEDRGGIRITVFNGFEPMTRTTAEDGSYCVPLTRSTDETFVSVFADKDSFAPQVKNVRVNPEQVSKGQIPVVAIPEMTLEPSPQHDAAILIGVAYVRTVSGRPRPIEGILEYDSGQVIRIEGQSEKFKVIADKDGVFRIPLPPGEYRLITDRNVLVEKVKVVPGKTTIVPLYSGERINF